MTDAVIETMSADSNVTMSTLSFVPSPEDNLRQLSCRADNPLLPASGLEEGLRLHVNFPPQVQVSLGSSINPESVVEGTDVYLECHVKANPVVYEVTWLFNNEPIDPFSVKKGVIITNQTLVLQRISRQWRGHYQCLARNEIKEEKSNKLFLRVQCELLPSVLVSVVSDVVSSLQGNSICSRSCLS